MDLQAAEYDFQAGDTFVIGFQGLPDIMTLLHFRGDDQHPTQQTQMRMAFYSDSTGIEANNGPINHRINVT